MKFVSQKTLLVSLLAVVPFVASAQLSSNISLTSNYKFRGQDQDQLPLADKSKAFKPALQGGFDYALSNGFYVGNWNSSVAWLDGNSMEVDVYGGYKGELSPGLSYDAGVIAYLYPGNSLGKTTEVYLGMGYGPFSAKYSQTVSKDYFFYGSKASYLNLGYATELTAGLTFKAAMGMTNFKDATKIDFSDYSVGLSYDLGEGYSLGGAYVGATKKADYGFANDNRVVLSLSKAM
ncbi:TorF family putative porin [uncultured Limnohabitans sp.]|uniref:TorF family putative porin n=1 Tax=uncultured Limnohabitans sp. TaxID=768543 RepID=UPI002603CCF5|nr:TorF family putative porin [uncultured Limnohabitans sp.]